VSAIGVLTIQRRYWKCRCGTTGGSYAVDEILGLDGRYSRTVQKHACRLSADQSFALAQENLREMLDVRVSEETVRTISENHGRAMQRYQRTDEETSEAFRKAEGEVEFTVDAGKVNTREEGWKDLKIGVIQKRKSGQPTTLADWNEQRLPVPTIVLAFAMIATSKDFRSSWRKRLRQLGVVSCALVHVLADGASWIWKSVQRVLTGCVQTLDFYHACGHLSKAAKGVFGEGTAEMETAYNRSRSLLLEKGWAGVCEWVSALLAVDDESEVERRRPHTERALGYFSKHTNRLNYAERLQSGRAIGSGSVEGKAKTLGLRLKARGARWRKANVPAVASLVCVRHSTNWASYWKSLNN
jgi:gas vesicle protein